MRRHLIAVAVAATVSAIIASSLPAASSDAWAAPERGSTVASADRSTGAIGASQALDVTTASIVPVASGSYEEADEAVVLSGAGWKHVVHSRDSGGGSAYTTTAGSYSLNFSGTSVTVVGRKTPSAGIASVTLDGAEVGRVDLYSASVQYQAILWREDELDPGSHTLTVSWTGQKNSAVTAAQPSIVVDRVVVFDTGTATTPTDVEAIVSGSAISVSWSRAAGYAPDSFEVFRRNGGDWVRLSTLPGSATSMVDSAVLRGETYEYGVVAVNDVGDRSSRAVSDRVAFGSAAGIGEYQENSQQIGLSGSWTRTNHSRDLGGSSAYLTTPGSASIRFEGPAVSLIARKTPSAGFARVLVDGSVVANIDLYSKVNQYQTVVWSSSTLGAGEHTLTYQRVSGSNAAVTTSTPSISIDAIVVPSTAKPAPPTGMTAGSDDGSIKVTWPAAAAGVAKLELYRSGFGGTQKIAELPSTATEFVDTDVVMGDELEYHMIAIDAYGNSSDASETAAAQYGSPAAIGTYEEDSPQLSFQGYWTRTSHSADSGLASSYSTRTSSVIMNFSGPAVRWVSRTGPKSGIAEVFIDGDRVARVDRYKPINNYQQVVWERDDLTDDVHRLEIRWTSDQNSASTGGSLVMDAIVVPPPGLPNPPAQVSARASASGARIIWSAPEGDAPASYRIYRIDSSDERVLIAEPAAGQLVFDDPGLPRNESFRYEVTAVDAFGLESESDPTAPVVSTAAVPSGVVRFSDCPSPTVRVSNSLQLKAALAAAGPGSSIYVADGVYEGSFRIEASGSAADPIWVCGSRGAVIKPNTLTRGTGFYVSGSNVTIAGMSVTQSLKGIMVVGADHVTLVDLRISNIGDEAVHFRSNSTNGIIAYSEIVDTGLTNPGFGEGVYIGTSSSNWCEYNNCAVDRSNRTAVLWNELSGIAAEGIEVKEGVEDTVIYGNTIATAVSAPTGVESALQLKGNDNIAMANSITTNRPVGIRVMFAGGGWGLHNVIAGNDLTLASDADAAIYLASRDNIVKCDNIYEPSSLPLGATCRP